MSFGIAIMHYQANISVKPELGWFSDTLIPWFTSGMFMVVSGFVLCCGYYERLKNGQITLNDFYAKRYKRMLPFFALLCVLNLIVDFSKGNLAQAFMNCTLVFNLLPNPVFEVIGVGWYMGVIFLFYMLFPFFVFLLDNKRRAWGVFCISLVINFLCQEYFFTDDFIDFFPGKRNILYASPFMLSGGLCFLYREKLHEWSAKRGNVFLAACLIASGLYFVCPQSEWTLHNFGPLLVVYTLWLVYAIGAEHKWLHNRFMDFISGISMELYLSHMVMFRVVEKVHLERMVRDVNLLFLLTCVAGIGLTVAFSYYGKKVVARCCRF